MPRGQKTPNMSTVAKIVTYVLGLFGFLAIFILVRELFLLNLWGITLSCFWTNGDFRHSLRGNLLLLNWWQYSYLAFFAHRGPEGVSKSRGFALFAPKRYTVTV